MARQSLDEAERALFAHYGIRCEQRSLALADPPLSVGALECGSGDPVVLVHGSGMCAATWAPVLAHLPDRRCIAIDLPGFGRSDPHSYTGRTLRAHAVAQLSSVLDALGLDRAPFVGTSMGALWTLCLALDRPDRVSAVVAIGMPAVALPGCRGDPFFTALTTPGVRRIAARVPPPGSAKAARRAMKPVLGAAAVERSPDELFEAIAAGMRAPGWREAMTTHLALALRMGRGRPENVLTEEELRSIAVPVRFIWGEDDSYGGADIGRRAAELIPDAELEVVSGRHTPFLDHPERCAEVIRAVSPASPGTARPRGSSASG